MTPPVLTETDQAPALLHAVLDVALPLEQAAGLLSSTQRACVEPLRRGPWGFVTLAVRWDLPQAELADPAAPPALTGEPGELWAVGLRCRAVTDRVDVIDTHAPLHLAQPGPRLQFNAAGPVSQRVFPVDDAAERGLPMPGSALVTDGAEATAHLHRIGFEHTDGHLPAYAQHIERVAVDCADGDLSRLLSRSGDPRPTAWLRVLGPGVWRGGMGRGLSLLNGGAMGGTLWGADAEQSGADPHPLVPPIAQPTRVVAVSAESTGVLTAS